MITIGKSTIREENGKAILAARLVDEGRKLDTEVRYSVDQEYGRYLCTENADAFLCGIYEMAMHSGQDIRVEAPVSAKFMFHLQSTIQPLFLKILPESKLIKISVDSYSDVDFKPTGVGCGCSLGVDSMASIYVQMDSTLPKEYRLTHLAFFNCGQLGDYEIEQVEQRFQKDRIAIQEFADAVHLPLVALNSNLNQIYKYCGVTLLH